MAHNMNEYTTFDSISGNNIWFSGISALPMSSKLELAQESISAITGTPPSRTVTITPIFPCPKWMHTHRCRCQLGNTLGREVFQAWYIFNKLRQNVLFYSFSDTPRFSLGIIYHDLNVLPCSTGNTCHSLRDSCIGQRFPSHRGDLFVLEYLWSQSNEKFLGVSLLLNRFTLSAMLTVFLTIGTYQWLDHESTHQHFPNCSFLLAFEIE